MNKTKSFLLIALITFTAMLFTGCPDPNNAGGNNMEPQYKLSVYITWEQQPEQSPGDPAPEDVPPMPAMIRTQSWFYDDMPSKSAFISKATLDSYTEKLAAYGLTQATGISGWYSDQNCTMPVSEGDLQEFYKGDSNYHTYEIYTKVNEDVSKLLSHYAVYDNKDRYEYSMVGGMDGNEVLLPLSPTVDDISKLLNKHYEKADFGSVKVWKKYNNETHQQEFDPWTAGTNLQGKQFIINTSQSFEDLNIYYVNFEYQIGIVAELLYSSILIPKDGIKVSKLLENELFNELSKDRCVFEIKKGEDEDGNDIYEEITKDTKIKPYDQLCIYFGLINISFGVKNGENSFTIPYTGSSQFMLPATASYEGEGEQKTKYATFVQSDIDKIWAKVKEYGFTRDGDKVYSYNSQTKVFSEFTPGTSKWSKRDLETSNGCVYIYFDVTDDCSEDKMYTKFFLVDSEGKVGNEITNNQFFFHKAITADELKQKDQLLNGLSFDVTQTSIELYEDKECTKAVTAGTTQVWGKTLYAKINKTFEQSDYYVYKIHLDNFGDEKVRYLISSSPTVDLTDINNFFTAFPNLKFDYFTNATDDYKVWAYTKPLTEEGYKDTAVTALEPFNKEYYIKVANRMEGRKYVSTTANFDNAPLEAGAVVFNFTSGLFITLDADTYHTFNATFYFTTENVINVLFTESQSSISMTLSADEKTLTIEGETIIVDSTTYSFNATLVLKED